jgi:hypothetical protein
VGHPWSEGKDWEPFEPPRYEQVKAMLPYTELLDLQLRDYLLSRLFK